MHIDENFTEGAIVILPCSQINFVSANGRFLSVAFASMRKSSTFVLNNFYNLLGSFHGGSYPSRGNFIVFHLQFFKAFGRHAV